MRNSADYRRRRCIVGAYNCARGKFLNVVKLRAIFLFAARFSAFLLSVKRFDDTMAHFHF